MEDKLHNQSVKSFEKQFEILTQSYKRSDTITALKKQGKIIVYDDSSVNQLMWKLQKNNEIQSQYIVNYHKSLINDSEIFVFFDKMDINFNQAMENLFPQGINDWQLLKIILRDLSEAFSYCKTQEIVLSNISLNKIFINSKTLTVQLAIFDFFQKHKLFKKELIIGDMCYMAPELFSDKNQNQIINKSYYRYNKKNRTSIFSRRKTVGEQQTNCYNNIFKQDVYLFAMIAYNILSGQKYYSDLLLCEALKQKKNGVKPDLNNFKKIVPKSFIQLLNQCMNLQAEERPNIEDIVSYFQKHKPRKNYKNLIQKKIIERYYRTVQISQDKFKL